MADFKNRYPENCSGRFYVDRECIACDACVMAAPDNFGMDENDGHAFVKKQPANSGEAEQCREAMEGCPVFAIGNDGEPADKAESDEARQAK
jgi:ferredoxin